VLYLAEVKKQTRGFIGGYKTELKLLACQHNDQTWSAVPNEEILTYEESNSMGEGTLILVNVGNNRQIQGPIEFAGGEMVRQLQKISRLMERGKEDQEKIEQWKQSLTYQSEILNRQKLEMEARLEQIEQMEAEFEYLDRQRQELDSLKQQLEEQRQRVEEGELRLGSSPDLSPDQVQFIESLVGRLADSRDGNPLTPLACALEATREQQTILATHWHSLEEQRREVERRQGESDRLASLLEQRSADLQSTRSSIESAKIQLQIQESVLASKQELLGRVNLSLQTTNDVREMVTRLARGEDFDVEGKVDTEALERLPLGELEEIVNNLRQDLDRWVMFVNDQEEELTVQCQAVKELQAKLTHANDFDRSNLEQELAEEQERKGMLDETLVGQRRNLRERQTILLQHLKVLKRRQGNLDSENEQKLNFEPVLILLAEHHQNTIEERQRLEREISHLHEGLQPVRDLIDSQWSDQEQNARELAEQERQWHSANLELTRLKTRVQLYESMLQPVQDCLDETRQKLEEISRWLTPVESNGNGHTQFSTIG
jgi:hypothetical protein